MWQMNRPGNEPLCCSTGHDNPEILDLLADTGLFNVLLHRYPTMKPLPTNNRGKKALDMALACVQVLQLIKKLES